MGIQLLLAALLCALANAQEVRVRIGGEVDDNLNNFANIPVGSHFDLEMRVLLPGNVMVPGQRARYPVLAPYASLRFVGHDAGSLVQPGEFEVMNDVTSSDRVRFSGPLLFASGYSLSGPMDLPITAFNGIDLGQLAGTYSQPLGAFPGLMSYQGLILSPLVLTIDAPLEETRFCAPMAPNSTGQSTVLEAYADPALPAGVHVEAWNGPPGQFGYLLVGTAPLTPGVPLGQGALCLDPLGTIGRFNLAGTGLDSTGQFDAEGRLANLVGTSATGTGFDLPASLPLPGSPLITAGQTWHFQLWHRDVGATSNLSNGVSLTF
ncbi:MAG: hypothetical protein R3F33_11360 [Planctomycetota bacterium]